MYKINTQQQHQHLCAVTLLGNLVAKPDIRYRANPVSAVTEITIATHAKWLDKKTNTYKEWTSFHHVKVEGNLVEQALLTAEKGDVILIQGYLSNIKEVNHSSIVHATFIKKFTKGYAQTINQIICSAKVTALPQLVTTQNNKTLAQMTILINHQSYAIDKQCWQSHCIERELHVWGKQALHLVDRLQVEDTIMVEGKLSYLATADKTQFIEAKTAQVIR